MCAIFLVFFPLSIAANYAAKDLLADVWLPVRVLVIVAVMTPIMTYFALPWITKRLHGWLSKA
jgi:antibiotic biosynthesis monooxygenase (ABM) superfamily enzyme